MSARTCIVADDQAEMRSLLVWVVEKSGYQAKVAYDGPSLLAALQSPQLEVDKVPLVITDLCMPGCIGFEALEWIKTWTPQAAVILITAFGSERTHQQAIHYGACKVINKPFSLPALKDAVQELVGHEARTSTPSARAATHGVVGELVPGSEELNGL